MAQGVTSEWEDIHVRMGNQVERPHESTLEEEEEGLKEKFESDVKANRAEVEEAKEALDLDLDWDLEDDDVLKEWKQQRMDQLQQETAHRHRFSGVLQVHYQDYITEVTNASRDCIVVLNLYHESHDKSCLINNCFEELSRKYSNIKFTKGIATKIIENFDIRALPTIIMQKESKILKQETSIPDELQGGLKVSPKFLEFLFRRQWGITEFNQSDFEFDDEYDPREEMLKTTIAIRGKSMLAAEKTKEVQDQKTQAWTD